METEVSLEGANADQVDENLYWKLVIPRERILFVKSPGTEEFDVFLIAMDEAMIVAMDAEWKPVRRAGVSPRVSILQMSCRIRKQSKAWASMERILLSRRIRAELEVSLNVEKSEVERQRDDLAKERKKLEKERGEMEEEVELEKRKVRTDRENLKRERAEKKRRDKKEREELEKAQIASHVDDNVDNRPTMTKLQDGLKDLVLGRNGEISEVAADLAGGVDVQHFAKNAVAPKVNTEDAEQNIDNLLDVLAQAQKELVKHQEGEQRTAHTEAKLEALSKDENLDPESSYAFPDDKNLLEENGLRSKDTEAEENIVNKSFEGNGELQPTSRCSGNESTPEELGGSVGDKESKSSNEQITDDGEDGSDGDQEFSDAGENEFEVEEDALDSVPELIRHAGHSKDGEGLTEEESERAQGEEVIFMLDLLALSAADFAFPMKKMLCSPRVLKLGFAFKNDQLHLAASFPDASGCFDKVEPYMDISKLYKQLLHANSASVKHKGKRFVLGGTYSLTGISKAVLGHPLRKDAQCSDWEQRPLTEDQIYYAAADTHCLLAMFDALLSDALALIGPPPAHTEAGDKPGLMIQQRAASLREVRGAGLKFLAGMDKIRETTPPRYIYIPKRAAASQMVEAALRPSPLSSPREPVATDEQPYSAERFSKFVKKYSERLLVNDSGRSKSHARRPRGRRAREALRNPDPKGELNLEWFGPAPWDVRIGGDGTPKFLCDVMVEGLARQLRCVGIDAASPPTKKSDPRQMVEQAEREGRILLTKDIKLLRRRLMPDSLAYFVKKLGKWEQLEEVMKVFQITVSESELLSRCVKCNGEFTPRPLSSKEAKAQAPATQDIPRCVLETCEEYWQCSVCGHLFWQSVSMKAVGETSSQTCFRPARRVSANRFMVVRERGFTAAGMTKFPITFLETPIPSIERRAWNHLTSHLSPLSPSRHAMKGVGSNSFQPLKTSEKPELGRNTEFSFPRLRLLHYFFRERLRSLIHPADSQEGTSSAP